VAQLQPTCLVGYAGLIDITHRTATLRAKGIVEVLEIQTETARAMLDTHESLGASAFRRALIVAMSGQLRTSNTSIGKLAVDVGIAEPDANQIITIVPIV
jgi:CRP-like cAMP-binding protein